MIALRYAPKATTAAPTIATNFAVEPPAAAAAGGAPATVAAAAVSPVSSAIKLAMAIATAIQNATIPPATSERAVSSLSVAVLIAASAVLCRGSVFLYASAAGPFQ